MKTTVSLFLVLISFLAKSQLYLDTGLVAKYTFSGNALDESGYGNHGTVYGATLSTDRFGTPNSCYYFNGINNYIKVPSHPSLNIDTSITITFWFKAEIPFSYNGWDEYLISKTYGNSASSYAVFANADVNHYDTLGFNYNFFTCPIMHYFFDNKWYFYAMFYDYSISTAFYNFNNSLYWGCGFAPLGLIPNNAPLSIGCLFNDTLGNSPTGFFKGYIDNIRVFKRTLSEQEIEDIYDEIITGNAPAESGYNPLQLNFNHENRTINVTFFSESESRITINIYDITGRLLSTESDNKTTGVFRKEIPANRMNDGIYIVQLTSGNHNCTAKIRIEE